MNWDAVGALSELSGAVAVVVTLVYLAAQIRQNTQSVATSVYEAALAGFNDLNRDLATNPEFASIVRRGGLDPTTLTEDELFRFNFHVRMLANHFYKLFRLYQQGAFPKSEWRGAVLEASQVFAMPGYADFKQRNDFFRELWAEIDQHQVSGYSAFYHGSLDHSGAQDQAST